MKAKQHDGSDAYEPGDLVKLKSGGPIMTVIEHSHPMVANVVSCTWFTQSDGAWVGPHHAQFRASLLVATKLRSPDKIVESGRL